MITIKIATPKKISGLYSVQASFNYCQLLIDTIKTLQPPTVWHKKEQLWEFSISELNKFLDVAVTVDEISLQVNVPEIRQISDSKLSDIEISKFKVRPYDHQIEAINYGLTHDKWLNLSGMGLGKTAEAIYLAETLHRRGLIDHCLVVCGVDSLRQNWKTEIQKFSNESVRVLGEKITRTGTIHYATLAERAKELINKISEFFVVVNITNIRDDDFVEAFKKSANKFDLVIFDECHRSTKKSQCGQNLLKLDAKYKVAMTGTLLVNSPISCYLPLAWTDNDHATLTNFKAQYCNFGGFNNSQIIGYRNLPVLVEEIESCSLRRTFNQVKSNMPKKTVEYEIVEMSDQHQKFYDAIKSGVKEEANKIELNTNNLLALMTRLRQATSAPTVLTDHDVISSKLERCVELAEDLLDAGEKVMILCNFKESVYELASMLAMYTPRIGTGDQTEDMISRSIAEFRNSTNYNLLIGTHSKLGTGFSMPECHYMLMVDTPYTDAQFSQSCDRIYRITSDQPVYIKVLVCQNTVDERIRQIVETKKELSDYIIDGKDSSKFTNELRSIIQDL